MVSADKLRIAELESRVASLEKALEKRSRELRLIQNHACSTDLVLIHRVSCGLPPLPQFAYELSRWNESPELNATEVEKALTDLWDYVNLAEKAAKVDEL
jgi:hypothetical protein